MESRAPLSTSPSVSGPSGGTTRGAPSRASGGGGGVLPPTVKRILAASVVCVAFVLIFSVSHGIFFDGGATVAGGGGGGVNKEFSRRSGEEAAADANAVDRSDVEAEVRRQRTSAAAAVAKPISNQNANGVDSGSSSSNTKKLFAVPPLPAPEASPLHRTKGAFFDDPSLAARCPETSATLGGKGAAGLPHCPSLGYTDKVFAAVRRVAAEGGGGGGAFDAALMSLLLSTISDDNDEPLRMALDPLPAVPHLRYAITAGRTTSAMTLLFAADDAANRLSFPVADGSGGPLEGSIPFRGAVHPAFEVFMKRSMRGQLAGAQRTGGGSSFSSSSSLSSSFSSLAKAIPEQKSAEEMRDHKNAKAGVEDSVWVGGYAPGRRGSGGASPEAATAGSDSPIASRLLWVAKLHGGADTAAAKSALAALSALSSSSSTAAAAVPSISYKPLGTTRVFEFNGVHTLYDFDCVPDIDFRQYHQVRAASCIDHERLFARAVDVGVKRREEKIASPSSDGALFPSIDGRDEEGLQLSAFRPASSAPFSSSNSASSSSAVGSLLPNYAGLFPIVDEEYFEYSFTLAVAHDAAVNGRPFTFVELGARYGTWLVRAAAAYRLFYRGPTGRDAHLPMSLYGSSSSSSSSVAETSDGNSDSGGRGRAAELSIPQDYLRLLAVEGNCHWFRRMEEHVRCNGLEPYSTLLLSYAAPPSYNKVIPSDPSTHKQPRAVSVVQMVAHYVELAKAARAERLAKKAKSGEKEDGKDSSSTSSSEAPDFYAASANDFSAHPVIDMIDFDIQGFESISLEHEQGAVDALTDHVGFIHFGTHGTEVETTLLRLLQPKGWCVVYFFAGAHTKNLARGHRCQTPYGSSVFNDGAMGLANMKFYQSAFGGDAAKGIKPTCPSVLQTRSNKRTAKQCYYTKQALTMLKRG